MGWPNPKKEAEKAIKQAVDKVLRPATKAAEDAVWKVRREGWAKLKECQRGAEQAIDKAEDTAEEAVKKVGHDVEDHLRNVGKEIEEGLTEELPELVTDALPDAIEAMVNKLASEAVKPGLQAAGEAARSMHGRMVRIEREHPDLVEAINNWSRSLDLQAVACIGLDYANFYARALAVAGIMERYAKEGIAIRRRDIKAFLEATLADTIRYGAGGELSLGVQLGASYTESMPSALFIVLADEILEELGVPE